MYDLRLLAVLKIGFIMVSFMIMLTMQSGCWEMLSNDIETRLVHNLIFGLLNSYARFVVFPGTIPVRILGISVDFLGELVTSPQRAHETWRQNLVA